MTMLNKVLLARLENAFCRTLGSDAYFAVRRLLGQRAAKFDELRILRQLLFSDTRHGFMVDVGAHNGESFCHFAYAGWDVLAFEPDPSALKQAMIRARSTKRVRLLNCPVSEERGQEVEFYTSPESSGVSSLSPFLDSHAAIDKILTTETLSSVLRDRQPPHRRIDFLKLDTEGHDLFAMRGLDWNDRTQVPRSVLCEFEDRKTLPLEYSHRDMGDFLVDKGYCVYLSEWLPIRDYGGDHDWHSIQRFPCDLADPDAWGNFIALDKSLNKRFESAIEGMGVADSKTDLAASGRE